MLRIPVGQDWIVTSDAYQLILNRKKTAKTGRKAGEEWLDALGYYPTLTQLVSGLIHHEISHSTINSVAGLAAEIDRVGKLCQEAFIKEQNAKGRLQ